MSPTVGGWPGVPKLVHFGLGDDHAQGGPHLGDAAQELLDLVASLRRVEDNPLVELHGANLLPIPEGSTPVRILAFVLKLGIPTA